LYLKWIKLQNFRNFRGNLELHFNSSTNVLVGGNAQGKTNLLEAIYCFAFAHSFRTKRDIDLINFESDFYKIEGGIVSNFRNFSILLTYSKKGTKEAYIDSIKCSALSKIIGKFTAVIFSPEHLLLVKGPPHLRRRYIDSQIVQVMPKYYRYLQHYRGIISHRNSLLKNKGILGGDISVWDEQLCSYGAKIICERNRVVSRLRQKASEIYKKISGSGNSLEIVYKSSLGQLGFEEDEKEITDLFAKKLKGRKEFELNTGFTTLGPHRDDISFFLDGRPLKEFGSQGQQRMAVLSLKLAEIDFIKESTGDYPVLLLDDVMSEMDMEKRRFFTGILGDTQSFITATDEEQFSKDFLSNTALWRIDNGKISRVN